MTSSGSVSVLTAVPTTPSALVLRFQASISFSGAAGAVGQLHLGSAAYIGLHAEI
jgi:hypothetical protein